MNTKERKRKDIEMKYAYMLGYNRGFKDAIPMEKFVSDLMELMNPQLMKQVERWAEKQMVVIQQTEAAKRLMAKKQVAQKK
jgi:hypothetical protein